MATRLYFTATTPAAISPAFDAGWVRTADAVRRRCSTSKAAATETLSGILGGSVNDDSLCVQLISPPLNGDQTILNTGTWTGVGDARELDVADNINMKVRAIKVVSIDGGTVRGTLVSKSNAGNTTELTTSLAGELYASGGGLTQVAALDNDRILIELGHGENATGTTPQWEFRLGGNGTDHAASQGDTTGSVAWVEFSQNLTFRTETDLVVNDTATDAVEDNVVLVPDLVIANMATTTVEDNIILVPDLIIANMVEDSVLDNVVLEPVIPPVDLTVDPLTVNPVIDSFHFPILYFSPPTRNTAYPQPRGAPHLYEKLSVPRGMSLLKENGVWTLMELPTTERILAAERVYLGGRTYGPLTGPEINELTAAGYGAYIFEGS